MNFYILENIRFPMFDATDQMHQQIADLGKRVITRGGQVDISSGLPGNIVALSSIAPNLEDLITLDTLVAEIFGLTSFPLEEYLKDIPHSTNSLNNDEGNPDD